MWVEFFDDVATLPAPFNIIPTPKTISRIFSLFFEKVCGKSWSISYHGKVGRRWKMLFSFWEPGFRAQNLMQKITSSCIQPFQKRLSFANLKS